MKPKTPQEIAAIRRSGYILATVLDRLSRELVAGMNGHDVERIAAEVLKKHHAKPVFKGVSGGPGVPDFPSIICISVDDAVVHGIPDDVPFRDGQLVSFDFGVNYEGMITDAARTIVIGGKPRTKREQELMSATLRSLDAGIGVIKPGTRVGDIGAAVQKVLDQHQLGIVRDLVGHGVGHSLHEAPEIPNYGFHGTGMMLREGMTIAVEPMATLGEWRVVVDPDQWTIRTRDGSLSAHFEDTLLVTKDGVEILTRL